MLRTLRSLGSFLVALLIASATVSASGGDAGSGADAGASRAQGLPIEFGSHAARLGPSDMDWYRAPGVSAATCLEGSVHPTENGVSFTLGYELGATGRLVNQFAPQGVTTTGGVATLGATTSIVGAETSANKNANGQSARPTDYTFAIRPVGYSPRSAADALTGVDAPESADQAPRVAPGCLAGHIDPLGRTVGDAADSYRVDAPANSVITYTFAAPSSAPIELRVYDAQRQLVGTVPPGGGISIPVETAGSYSFTAARTQLVFEDVPYLVGIVIGPPDPGSGCRPMCVL